MSIFASYPDDIGPPAGPGTYLLLIVEEFVLLFALLGGFAYALWICWLLGVLP